MRAFGLMASLLMISACNTPETQSANQATPDQSTMLANNAFAEPIQNALPAAQSKPDAAGHPCQTQGDKAVTQRLKALGTEPFWTADVDGRCVTYKTPEDQQGTRIWAHVDTASQRDAWKGALNGQEFQLIVKPAGPQGCSDGMSDKTYPLDAVLRVEGETRNGCAERL
jgi:uncharacterized membrane protein